MNVSLIDCVNNDKILVDDGETVIGRGPFLKVTDKRVSRNHAILKLWNGILSVKPVHKNPTFFRASNQSNVSSLPKDIWKELVHGDVISLLPEDLFFTVSIETDKTQEYEIGNNLKKSLEHGVNDLLQSELSAIPKHNDQSGNELSNQTNDVENEVDKHSKSQCSLQKRTLPAWMLGNEMAKIKKKNSKARVSKKKTDKDCEHSSIIGENPQQKEESESVTIEKEDVETAEIPCYSNKEPKNVCPYGLKCYRKNPGHFQEYSHPTDDLDHSTVKPECEYGSTCYRKNTKHFEEFSHTNCGESKTTNRATTSRKRKSTKEKSVLDNTSDDNDEENAYDFDDSFIDDDDEGENAISSESFVDENDSDFNPDDEDINELVEEAKQFVHQD